MKSGAEVCPTLAITVGALTPYCFATDPNPDLVIWHRAKTNETAPDPDLRSCNQLFICVIYQFLQKGSVMTDVNNLVFSICSLALILQGLSFETTLFPSMQTSPLRILTFSQDPK